MRVLVGYIGSDRGRSVWQSEKYYRKVQTNRSTTYMPISDSALLTYN